MKKAKVDLKIVQSCGKTVVEQMLSVRKGKRGKGRVETQKDTTQLSATKLATKHWAWKLSMY